MLQEYLPIISLLVLVFVVAIGFIKKINLGFFALGAAFVRKPPYGSVPSAE